MSDLDFTCEGCNKLFDLDYGFLNIAEICDATLEEITKYELDKKVDLQNYWCAECGSNALKEIEEGK